MELDYVDFDETECFDPIFLDYIKKNKSLASFYGAFPVIDNFKSVIAGRQLSEENRATLVDVISGQYGPLETTDSVEFNIHSLSNPKTFTVTTGHQLNIFTGPLYFIFKIVTVINTCKKLKAKYPEYNFVPMYWMASEDHDLEEIRQFNLFGKEYRWETDQKGPVGPMKPHTLNTLIDQLPESVPLFEQAYLDHDTLADAVRYYINELFGDYGLVVIDANEASLKKEFASVMTSEIFENTSNGLVEQTSKNLSESGYKVQAFSREINLFYMGADFRERIVKNEMNFSILNTELTFTADELKAEIEKHPERFSPNVILRPLYQETILPNLAYSGGPAEMAYWFQLKPLFDHYNIVFPVLLPRVFGLVVNKANEKKVQKMGLSSKDLFKSDHVLKAEYLAKHSENGFGLEAERSELAQIFEKIKTKAEQIDGSLTGFIGAEGAKSFKSVENISKRLKKAEEDNNETAMNQIDTLKEKLFPKGGLQERHDNFLTFQLNHPDFIQELINKFDPFDLRFHVLHDV